MNGSGKGRLRIGLFVDSFTQPQWVYKVIEGIKNSSVAETVLVIKNSAEDAGEAAGRKPEGKLKRVWRNRDHLLYALYTKLDERIFSVEPDAFKRMSVEGLLADCPVINVAPVMGKFTDAFPDEDVETILGYKLDVALRFGFRILKGRALQVAKHGVWSYHHGDGLVNRGSPPGFWEVMEGQPITGSMLQVLTEELDNGKVLYRSWAPTVNKFSVKKNRNSYYWKSAAFVMRKLKELYENGCAGADCGREAAWRPYNNRLYKRPTNSEMLPLLTGLTARAVGKKINEALYDEQWSLAYRFKTNPADANNAFYRFKYLIPPRGRFWADPFPVKVGDRHYIFFEDYVYKTGKAHISVVEVDAKGGAVGAPVVVLEKEYHLSYPFMFEWQGVHYMIPETGANRTVELYRCVSFPHEWELEKVLMEDVRAVDATLAEIEGRWWMFVNIAADGVLRNWDELHLFYADDPLGAWHPHRRNPVKSDVRSARPAGRLFRWNGGLYRPAQDCSEDYGYAISVNKILRISADEFVEEEVSKILPRWRKDVVATHTLNSAGDLTVIDCKIKRRKF